MLRYHTFCMMSLRPSDIKLIGFLSCKWLVDLLFSHVLVYGRCRGGWILVYKGERRVEKELHQCFVLISSEEWFLYNPTSSYCKITPSYFIRSEQLREARIRNKVETDRTSWFPWARSDCFETEIGFPTSTKFATSWVFAGL